MCYQSNHKRHQNKAHKITHDISRSLSVCFLYNVLALNFRAKGN